jgi:hypothetical protein
MRRKEEVLWRTAFVNRQVEKRGEATQLQYEAFLAFEFVDQLIFVSLKFKQRLIQQHAPMIRA